MIGRLDHRLWFPDPRAARRDGLVAVGGDFSVERLLLAYRSGIFPWTASPLSWWSPDPRCVLLPGAFRRHRSLVKAARNRGYAVARDRAFAAVIDGCAAPRGADAGTWITPEMRAAYLARHAAGHAHSVEVWDSETLVGGLYGVQVGAVFFGESMFSRVPDASKIALMALVDWCGPAAVELIDCQFPTDHLQSLGATELSRRAFLARVRALTGVAG